MENRERDRVSQRTKPTEAGELNRSVEESNGRQQNSGTSAEFGQNIGRSENLEGGTMNNNRNRNEESNSSMGGGESSRRPGSDYNSSMGRSGSIGNMGGGGSEIDTGKRRGNSTGEVGSSEKSGSRNDSSEGRH